MDKFTYSCTCSAEQKAFDTWEVKLSPKSETISVSMLCSRSMWSTMASAVCKADGNLGKLRERSVLLRKIVNNCQ